MNQLSVIFTLMFVALTNFCSSQSSNPVGSAFDMGDNCYVVTQAINSQTGAVWFNDQIDLSDPLNITMIVSLGSSDAGADGMVFTMQQVSTNALGMFGGGLGFEGFSPSLGVELDTYNNADNSDLVADHMAILSDGFVNHDFPTNLAGPVPIASDASNVEDGQDHVFEIDWDPNTQIFKVFFDCDLRLELNYDIINDVFEGDPNVFWGFTGSTGGLNNLQTVCIEEYALGLENEYQVCEGESIELGVLGPEDGTYSWTPTDFLDDPNSQSPISTPTEDIVYEVTYTNFCGEQLSLETSVNFIDIDYTLDDSLIFCENVPAEAIIVGDASYQYEWENGSTDQETNVIETGYFDVQIVSEVCSIEDSLFVLINELPSIEWSEEVGICEGEEITITQTEDFDFLWSDGESDNQIVLTDEGAFSVIATSDDGCEMQFDAMLTINDIPDIGFPDELQLCDGQSHVLTPNEGDVIEWSDESSGPSITITEPGQYSVVVDQLGCQNSDVVNVIFNPNPEFSIADEYSICPDSIINIVLPGLGYDWSFDGESVSDSIEIVSGGDFVLAAQDPSSFCTSNQLISVEQLENPIAEVAPLFYLCDGGSVEVTIVGDPNYDYFWSDGAEDISYDVVQSGFYEIEVENECSSIMLSTIVEDAVCDCNLYIPSAITIDGNGLNETFQPIFDCIVSHYSFQIFNRFGEVIFETIDPAVYWSGQKNQGEYYVPDGVYAYRVSFETELLDGVHLVDQFGHVTVIR